ncbi:cell surface protein [Candidatus Vecturithrix granuli]|uniref:Cell surface protein n=1 Tax=Vecturithrix granuli TaxID=1499967 RepID=A0A081BYL0_VECG1|nr:cell surface protein [Candidatus Vecturithrix granuli]
MTVQPARITEGRTATVTVKLSDAADGVSVTLNIDSLHSADLTITTTNPKPSESGGIATFTIQAVVDTLEEGLENAILTATATGYTSATADVFIRDSGEMSGDTLTFPSFVLHASYDWLHNFSDNNQSASGAAGDPDSDNFNKLIMIDSNLFPIYTALQGDAEMPNVVMRNWTSGPGIYSPSVNDYMNRSVAAAADYINVTSKIPFGYGATDSLDAVGMRSYLQWVYALDPANHNFRRYKFIKIQDSVPDVPYWDSSVGIFEDKSNDPDFEGTADKGIDCPQCDPDFWYVVNYNQSVVAYDKKCPSTCYDDGTDTKFLIYAKKQNDGMTSSDIDPPVRFQVPVSAQTIDTQSTVDVSMNLKGFKTANDATMSFILNADSVESTCQQTTNANTDNSNYGLNNGGCGSTNGSCRMVVTVSFDDVPTSCASNCNSQYCYMTIDMKPLDKNHGGWFIELPNYEPPKEKDNAFRIPVVGYDNITGGEWDMLTDTEKQKKIETRWGNIAGYLDVMPPRSYPGYVNYTARVGYGYQTNTTFSSADNVRFKDPRDIAVYRDYFDQANGGPVYIFVADTSNSRIQVFMNATGVAGDPGAAFPIRPVRVKGPNDNSAKTYYKSNELGMRIYSSNGESVRFGDGRKADWRQYTTMPGDTFVNISAGKGEFYYPHSIAVDQDPDTKDVYLFVADTFNHRIQVFRDVSGVSSQAITAKKFDFKFEAGWGTYPLQTSEFMTNPGAYNFRYPKGLSVARFKNNSSLLYVVDSKDYRLMKYEIGENGDGGIKGVVVSNGYGFNGTYNSDGSPRFVKDLLDKAGKPLIKHVDGPGFWNPQDVATGYSGFFNYTSPHGRGTKFLNNYMVYVTDYARNMTSITRNRLNTRVMQFIEVPGVYKSISGAWIPWQTEVYSTATTLFPKGALGQSVYGITDGVYNSTGAANSTGASGNVPGRFGYFTDRPVGITALQWNTLKPIDIRVVDSTKSYLPGESLPLNTPLRIGVSSRKLSFGYPETNRIMFTGYSSEWTELTGRWDATDAGRVHLFCYDKTGKYISGSHKWVSALNNKGVLFTPPFLVTLSPPTCTSPGFVKIVVEDVDFNDSARTGTAFYGVK